MVYFRTDDNLHKLNLYTTKHKLAITVEKANYLQNKQAHEDSLSTLAISNHEINKEQT